MANNWEPSNRDSKPAKYDSKDWNATDITLLKKYNPKGGWSLNSDSDAAAKAAASIRSKLESMHKQGTQLDHAVTDSKNHTKPVTAADKQANAKRPAVGNDKSAAKKANGPSWNNGYTN